MTAPLPASPARDLAPSPPDGWPRRIALVCDWYTPRLGGIERHLTQLAGRLVQNGRSVTVITPMAGANNEVPGVELQRVPARLLPGAGLLATPASFRRLGRMIRGGAFDVVHVHTSIISPAAFAAIHHAQAAGLPTVSTTHSILGGYVRAFAWLHRRFRWGAWPVVYTGVSERVTRELSALIAPRLARVLPNAVDPAEWTAPVCPPGDGTVTAACVMRLVPRKRGAALIRAIATVAARLPTETRFRLRIAGDGPQRKRLEALARSLGVGHRVDFLGAQSPAAVKALLAASDFFVLSSRLEAFGIAALEARALGLPVLALRESGVSEFITDDVDGLLADDDPEFAAQLARLVTDAGLRHRITAHNRAVPVACTWDRVLARHLEVYAEARALVAPAGGRRAP